ncbi:MAG: nucleoside-triphosphatase [Elusimicrobiota bacterium]
MKSVLISAPVGWGKTFLIKSLFAAAENKGINCGGFWAEKKNVNGIRNYYAFFPKLKKEILLACVYGDGLSYFPYSFDKTLKYALKDFDKPFFFLDEIGPLELMGRGHNFLIENIKKKYGGIFLASCRNSLSQKVKKYIDAEIVFETPKIEEIILWTGLK